MLEIGLIVRYDLQRNCHPNRTRFFRLLFRRGVGLTEVEAMEDIRTTKVLVAEAQQGDRPALNELCDRYVSRVLVAVRARLGDGLRRKVESWDVVQEVMIDAIGNLNEFTFRTEGAFLNYLNRVVENRIRDEADRWAAQKSPAGSRDSVGCSLFA